MPGSDNSITYNKGLRVEPIAANGADLMQKTADDMSVMNISGSPEGVYAANPGSIASDRAAGSIYKKASGTGNTGWVELSDTDLHTVKFIVGDTSNGANYATIAAAITAASSGDVIYLQPGTYTENLTISKDLTIASYDSTTRYLGTAVISGKITVNASINVKFVNLELSTNGDNLIESTSAGGSISIGGCFLAVETGVYGFNLTNASGPGVRCDRCYVVGAGTAALSNSAGSTLFFDYCNISGCTGASSVQSGGSITFRWSIVNAIITTSNAATVQALHCQWGVQLTPYLNVTYLTSTGTGVNRFQYCSFYSGTASAMSIGSGTTANLYKCMVNSSNASALAGAGTIVSDAITWNGSSTVNAATTQSYVEFGKNTTFTPVLEFGGASTGITYSSQVGQYVRIGNLVWFRVQIQLTSKGSSTGSATITGFPFTRSGLTVPLAYRIQNLTFAEIPIFRLTTNIIYCEEVTSGGALTALTDADFANNTLIQVSGTFFAV